jgi:hypothetical protein
LHIKEKLTVRVVLCGSEAPLQRLALPSAPQPDIRSWRTCRQGVSRTSRHSTVRVLRSRVPTRSHGCDTVIQVARS